LRYADAASDQGIVQSFIQATNFPAFASILVDLKMGSEKKLRWKFLDREADCVRSVRKTSVGNWLSSQFAIAAGEKLRLSAVVKLDHNFIDRRYV
jgi:hypothetical protein